MSLDVVNYLKYFTLLRRGLKITVQTTCMETLIKETPDLSSVTIRVQISV